jgi:hypothetical protein
MALGVIRYYKALWRVSKGDESFGVAGRDVKNKRILY